MEKQQKKIPEEKEAILLPVEKSVPLLEEGKYLGKITQIVERHEPYHYLDIWIAEDKTDAELKYGVPAKVTKKTKLGLLLQHFISLNETEDIDIKKELIGQLVSFMVRHETREDMTFNKIVDATIRPIQKVKVTD
ncbi:MAG: hypothetical protein HQ536_02600 [Parcubacteria group bacterium]|nr:hypothetical protein [Parcubacteria group bacterium]